MKLDLEGKTIIVTAATANIGRAIALGFAGEGAKLILNGRDVEAGKRLVETALHAGATDARFVAADMRDPASPALLLEIADDVGPVDVLVNNVGCNVMQGFFVESDPAGWQDELDFNLGTVLRMSHKILPGMIARQSGAIVNIGSISGIVGDYMLPVYSAAKAAVHGFTKVLAKEVGQHGIRVNAVAPYATMATDMAAYSTGSRFHPDNPDNFMNVAADIPDEHRKKRIRRTQLGRPMARPEEVASLVVWLASEQAGFVTGQIYPVDGGSLL